MNRLGFSTSSLILAAWTGVVGACPPIRPCSAQLQGELSTPADDAIHCPVEANSCNRRGVCQCSAAELSPYELEWWYWTAHLRTTEGRWFGFAEVVYSAIDLESYLPLTWADHTVSDIDARRYYFGGRETVVGLPARVPNGFSFFFPTASIHGGNGHDHIRSVVQSDGKRFLVDLDIVARKAPVLQRADGLVQYYSRERMDASGTLEVDGVRWPVQGTVWFDHQFGLQRTAYQYVQSWTWIAIQLEGERELVVYQVDLPDWDQNYPGGVYEGTLTERNCRTTRLGRDDFQIVPQGTWQSPWMPKNWPSGAECRYPMGWQVRVPSKGLELMVAPFFPEQEIIVPEVPGAVVVGDRYWEGAAAVSGTAKGRAYVEMMGYCPYAPPAG